MQTSMKKFPQNYIEALHALADAEEEIQRLSNEIIGLNYIIGHMQPRLDYLDIILNNTVALSTAQIAKDYGLSEQKLNSILHEEGIQYKVGGQWVLYQCHEGKGYTKTYTHAYTKNNSDTGASLKTKWTKKGRLLIHYILTTLGYQAEIDKIKENIEFN